MTLAVGQTAPDFTLPSSGGESVTLSHLVGQRAVVVYFYPKDETPGCTVEACTFRDQYEAFVQAGAEVVGISSDSVASHDAFRQKHGLPMKLLSDADGKVRAQYGVKANAFGLLPGRVTFVIDRSGRIAHVFVSQLRFARHVDEALEVVRRLNAAAPAATASPAT
jgi:peroxiredoxin Q/BCP